MRLGLLIVASLVLAACNAVFGLEETRLVDGGEPQITFVQINTKDFQNASSAELPFPQPVVAGDALIVGVYIEPRTADLTRVIDAQGNSFTRVVGPVANDSFGGNAYLYAAFDARGGADTIAFTATAGATEILPYIHEFANVTAFDAGAGAKGSSGANDGMSSGTIQTRQANELLFGFGVTAEAAAGTGFVALSQFNCNVTEERVVDAPGAYAATATMHLGLDWTMLGAAFIGR